MTHAGAPPTRIAASHLLDHSPEWVDALLRCLDLGLLRTRLLAAGLCDETDDDNAILEAYFTRDACKLVSPNKLFNEVWYRSHYPDVAAAATAGGTTGFVHFIAHGIAESRWPNESMQIAGSRYRDPAAAMTALDAAAYVQLNSSAQAFLEAFPVMTALEHYNRYGRLLHLAATAIPQTPGLNGRSALVALMESEFDPEFYADTYLVQTSSREHLADPFRHYLTIGIEREYSPNAWFQEDWYRAYYADVRAAIPRDVPCGFHHYLEHGRIEGRLPRFDLTAALEARLPGVTAPVLVNRTETLRNRLHGDGNLRAFRRADDAEPATVWFLLPTLHPDIAFGGYRAAFELVRSLVAAGRRVAIYCTEEPNANKGYFLWREHSEKIREAFADVKVLGRYEDDRIGVCPRDRVVAYSVWDLYRAAALAKWTDFRRPFLLAQEYEPVFFDNSSSKVLCHETYSVPHYPIINSSQLRDYFRANRIGVFAADEALEDVEHYAVFEHHINQLPRQTAASMAARRSKVLALYARPELHASRNLFELTLLALQNLCGRGLFGAEWSFVGLGALSDVPPLELGRGHRLELRQRTTEEEYVELLHSLDVGISMMYAPHPGVVAREFATTGAMVTNVYENRTAADLRRLSENIVPCEFSLRDLERAIVDAVRLSSDYASRERNAHRPVLRSWEEIFSRDFLSRTFRLDA